MLIARWIIAGLFGLIWLLIILGPLVTLVTYAIRKQERGVSFVPLIGSLVGLASILVLPIGTITQRLFYLPIALLPDVPFIIGLPGLVRQLRASRRQDH